MSDVLREELEKLGAELAEKQVRPQYAGWPNSENVKALAAVYELLEYIERK